jgi:protein TonB
VNQNGEVTGATVKTSVAPLLDAAALAAVRQWRYTPALKNGQPVEVIITVTVSFSLR